MTLIATVQILAHFSSIYLYHWAGIFEILRGFNSISQATANLKLVVTTSISQQDEYNKTIYIGYGKGGGGPIE